MTTVSLAFEEAVFGVTRELDVARLAACERCMGNGAEPGTAPVACRTCGGAGEVQQVRRSIFGTMMTAALCNVCRGTGQEVLDPCTNCSGEGRVRSADSVTVEIPAGVDDGMDLRVGGAGNAGLNGGPPGDLYVSMHVEPSPSFERRGQDLVSVLEIPFTQAALGAEIDVRTLDTTERIRIEPGTETGSVIRLRGAGVPNVRRRGRGDLFVQIHVAVPDDLPKDQRRLVEQLAELRDERSSKREPATTELKRPQG